MVLKEFDVIKKYFTASNATGENLLLSVGDDAALVSVPAAMDMALCIDTLVAGVHFPKDTLPHAIAYKAIAVNLSDLAAMGAEPQWVTMALTLPQVDENWLKQFSDGVKQACKDYSIKLIGGDLTQGPLTITVQAHGFIPKGKVLTRSGAKIGDKIFVSGQLGTAAFALKMLQQEITGTAVEKKQVLKVLNYPKARVEQGLQLRNIASSCIDISDGLVADLGHILEQSAVGAKIYLDKLPIDTLLNKYFDEKTAIQLALTGGDDYQLCFTVSSEKVGQLQPFSKDITCMGEITAGRNLIIYDKLGEVFQLDKTGYQHFQ